MKSRELIFVLLAILTLSTLQAQVKIGKHDFPHVTKNEVGDYNLFGGVRHVISFPGVWGLGIQGEFLEPNLVYASAEAGYGWVIGKHDNDFDKKWRPWIDLQAGYPALSWTSKKNGKWVTSEYGIGNGMKRKEFYNIAVPVERTLIPFVSYKSIPFNARIYADDGPSTHTSVNAAVFSFGIKLLSRLRSDVRVIDSGTGKEERGSLLSRAEILIAMSKSIGDVPNLPEGYGGLQQYDKMGLELMFKIPFGISNVSTFDFGLRGLHLSSKDGGQAGQLYIGNTFFF